MGFGTNKKVFFCISSICALSAGFLCYYFFRDYSDLLFFKITDIKITPGGIRLSENIFTKFIKYNLCDGLWLLSGILFLRFVWFDNPGVGKYYVIIFIGIAVVLELLQMAKNFPGTFDVMDILTMVLFALLEHYYYRTRSIRWVKEG